MKLYSEVSRVNRIFIWQFETKKMIEQQVRCDNERLIASVTGAVFWVSNLQNKNKSSMTYATYSLEFSICQEGDHFYS